jgi:hypothetical protein
MWCSKKWIVWIDCNYWSYMCTFHFEWIRGCSCSFVCGLNMSAIHVTSNKYADRVEIWSIHVLVYQLRDRKITHRMRFDASACVEIKCSASWRDGCARIYTRYSFSQTMLSLEAFDNKSGLQWMRQTMKYSSHPHPHPHPPPPPSFSYKQIINQLNNLWRTQSIVCE